MRAMDAQAQTPRAPVPVNPRVRRFVTPFVMIAAFLYFIIDLLFELFLRPINRWLARNRFFARIADWIESLGPYPTLALFLVPQILLEPTNLWVFMWSPQVTSFTASPSLRSAAP
jgi:hypothetical protein